LLRAQWSAGLGGVLIANPVPEAAALSQEDVEGWISTALQEAGGISGKDLTPYLLRRLAELSKGATSRCNEALLEHNAGVAAEIAVGLAEAS
jgi:pseudouridine-5'-phosphate glycosidase